MCSKQLSTMRNRFLTLPNAENLHFNEFLTLETSKIYIVSKMSKFTIFQKMPKFRPVLKYVAFHAEFESKLRFA